MLEPAQEHQIARSAAWVSIGNVLSRVMGLIRDSVVAGVYGASGALSAYLAARQVPFTAYEMLIGGMVSSALVPTLSDHAAPERRDELWRLASLLFTLAALGLAIVILLLELAAPLLSQILVHFDDPLRAETTLLLRIMLPAVFFFGLSGLSTALCQALQRFALPAFTTAVLNSTLVVVALLLGPRWVIEIPDATVDAVRVGDTLYGRVTAQDRWFRAEFLAVVPAGTAEAEPLGTVTGIEGSTLKVEDERGERRIVTDDETVFRVQRRQVSALAIGLVVGAALQVALQLPALRDMCFRPALDLRDPALRHILRLYLPIVLSLVVASLAVVLDRNLASRTGESSIAWMGYATALIQFPLGLVSMAIATAILPALARLGDEEKNSHGDTAPFRATLASGLRLVLVLIIPAATGLLVLARPVVALLFQHGEFSALDTAQTALALRFYLIGLAFAAIDLPLVYSFYARKDTWRPAMVGIASVGFYLVVALPTMRTLGMVGLILANGAQLAGHALVMAWLFQRRIGTLRGYRIGHTLLRSLIAAGMMGLAVYGISRGIESAVPAEGLIRWMLTVLVGGTVGLGVYLALCALLGVREIGLVQTLFERAVQRLPVLRTSRNFPPKGGTEGG